MLLDEKLLVDVSKLLAKYNIKYCLIFGTLLGVYRDNKIIEKDDIDLAIFSQFWKDDKLWHNFFIDLYKLGYCIHELAYNYICIKLRDINTDLHIDLYFFKNTDNLYQYQNSQRLYTFISDYFEKLDNIEFRNNIFNIPNNTEKFLEYHYGNDWKIPRTPEDTYRPNSISVVDDYEKLYTFTYIESIYKKDLL